MRGPGAAGAAPPARSPNERISEILQQVGAAARRIPPGLARHVRPVAPRSRCGLTGTIVIKPIAAHGCLAGLGLMRSGIALALTPPTGTAAGRRSRTRP